MLSTSTVRNTGPTFQRSSALALILLGGLAARLLLWYAFRDEPLHIWDERDYDALARNLLADGTYTLNTGGTPTSIRPPLYPAFIAAIYSVAGVGNFAAVRLVQIVLGLLTTLVAYGLGREISSRRAALWSAGLCCFYPSLLAYDCLLLTEVLFTFLLCTTCYLVVLTFKRGSVGCAVAAGLVLGLAALTRSVVWLAPPFLAVFLLLACQCDWGRRLAISAALVTAFAATVAPWAIRNTRLQETFIAIDTMGGRNFMMGNYQYTPLYRSWDAIAIEGERSWIHEVNEQNPSGQRRTQGQIDKAALRLGLEFVREHPGLTAQRSIVKFFDFWGLERELVAGTDRGYFGRASTLTVLGVAAVINLYYVAALVLATFGLMFAPPTERRAHWLILSVIAFVCGLHVIVFGHSRYHVPLIPLVLIYAAGAVTNAGAIWGQRKSLRFALALGLCAILFAGWTWMFFALDWERFSAELWPAV